MMPEIEPYAHLLFSILMLAHKKSRASERLREMQRYEQPWHSFSPAECEIRSQSVQHVSRDANEVAG